MSSSILIWTNDLDWEYTMSHVHTLRMRMFSVFGEPLFLMHDKCFDTLMQIQHMHIEYTLVY